MSTTTTTTCVVENNEQTSAPVFSGALAQVPQQVESEKKKMVRLSSLLRYSEKKLAAKMAAIAVQECDGGPIQYRHANSMVPETAVIVRDKETGTLVGLPAVMGG